MKDKDTIINLLNKLSRESTNMSWAIRCVYCDGMGTTFNQIEIITQPENQKIGVFAYQVETGEVCFFRFKEMKKPSSGNIIDTLLDLINYSKSSNLSHKKR